MLIQTQQLVSGSFCGRLKIMCRLTTHPPTHPPASVKRSYRRVIKSSRFLRVVFSIPSNLWKVFGKRFEHSVARHGEFLRIYFHTTNIYRRCIDKIRGQFKNVHKRFSNFRWKIARLFKSLRTRETENRGTFWLVSFGSLKFFFSLQDFVVFSFLEICTSHSVLFLFESLVNWKFLSISTEFTTDLKIKV